MKNIVKILMISFLIIGVKSNAQLDTLNYLKTNFEIQKSEYIGKPFSFLLSKMSQIQPKTVWSTQSQKDFGKIVGNRFKFCDMDYSFYNAITLSIRWQEPILTKDVKYYEQKNGFYFTDEEKVFYANKIIKDIRVYR